MYIEGIIEFENTIPIENTCLDKEYSIDIGGVPGVFATPVHPKIFEAFSTLTKPSNSKLISNKKV